MFSSTTRRRLTRLVWAMAIGLMIIIGYDAVSLLFDGADLVRYIRGDRAEIVKGL